MKFPSLNERFPKTRPSGRLLVIEKKSREINFFPALLSIGHKVSQRIADVSLPALL